MKRTAVLAPDDSVDVRLLGGKGANLCRLHAWGFAVPRFVVLTTAALEARIADRPLIRQALRRVERHGLPAVAAAAEAIERHIVVEGCPAETLGALRGALERAGLRGPFAVRSSIVGEDAAAHSFAGVMETALDVPGDALGPAVARVWASAFSARALGYRLRKGLGVREVQAAVVIQEMAPAAIAGVLFTRDLDDPAYSLIVSAPGRGDGVVRGDALTATCRVLRSGDTVTAAAGLAAPALSEAQARALRDLGLKIERAFGEPQDVEWAIEASGQTWVLQARPVTGTGAGRSQRVWDNSNIVESYPGLTLPLTFSFARQAYETAFRELARHFFPLLDPLARRPHLFKSLIGLVEGRVYYNLLDWYEMFTYLADPDAHRRAWDRMIGVTRPQPASGARAGIGLRLLAALRAASILLGVGRLGRRFFARFGRFLDRHGAAPAGGDAAALALRYRALEAEAGSFWHLTLFNDLAAIRYHAWLLALCRRFLPDRPALANDLLCGAGDMESVAPLRAVAALARQVSADPALSALFSRGGGDAAVWRALESDPRWAAFHLELEAYLDLYGDRGAFELKLETRTPRQDPALLVALLRRQQGDACSAERGASERRHDAEAALAGCGLVPRLALGFVVRQARRAIRNRENMRFARARLYGLVRAVFTRLGEELHAGGVLRDPHDVFHLTVDEVLGCVEGTGVTRGLAALVALRQDEYRAFATREVGDRIETSGLPRRAPTPAAGAAVEPRGALCGIGCSTGVGSGVARIVADPRTARVAPGEVLVARSTDPGWVFLMMQAGGLVAERGSLLSHTAILGRELGIPTVVGVADACARIPEGARLTLDGRSGEVRWA
ncbi:MAG: PEP-utilizing enzyme [Vicinamibacteria bacterium]|nr:PEP-utilizing enzyme [Vicinamibacteria bacterium]